MLNDYRTPSLMITTLLVLGVWVIRNRYGSLSQALTNVPGATRTSVTGTAFEPAIQSSGSGSGSSLTSTASGIGTLVDVGSNIAKVFGL